VTLARVAAGAFALFYGAAEAIAGIATGTLVRCVFFDLPPQCAARGGRDAHRNGAGAVDAHTLLVNQITRRTR
jgi:hypothetical protein